VTDIVIDKTSRALLGGASRIRTRVRSETSQATAEAAVKL
jgi:hypothetical protein